MIERPFKQLGKWTFRHRWLVIVLWLVVTAAAGIGASQVEKVLVAGSGEVPQAPSTRVEHRLHEDFDNPFAQALLLAVHSDRQEVAPLLERMGQRLTGDPHVLRLATHRDDARLKAPDPHDGMLLVGLKASNIREAERLVPTIREAIRPLKEEAQAQDPTLQVAVTGRPALTYDINLFNAEDSAKAEGRVLPVTLLVLLFAFGALVAAGVPLVMGMLAVSVSLGIVYLMGHQWEMSLLVKNVATMIGLAVGIDYSLLMVNRFREGLSHGHSTEEAVAQTVESAGVAVVYSGLTVMIGLGGLLLTPLLETRSIGLGGCLVVLVAVLLAVTFLPAVLGVLGPRIDSPRRWGRRVVGGHFELLWRRWAELIMDRPKRMALLALVVLAALAWPVSQMKMGFPSGQWLPQSMEVEKGLRMLEAMGQGGLFSPVNVLVENPQGPILTPEQVPVLLATSLEIKRDPRVARVFSPFDLKEGLGPMDYAILYDDPDLAMRQYPMISETFLSRDRKTMLFQVILKDDVPFAETKSFARQMAAMSPGGLKVEVGGQASFYNDFDKALWGTYPLAIGFVLVVTFLVLALAFRSVLVPFKAVLMNLLSVGAGFGAVVAVFQLGFGKELVGLSAPVDAIPLTIPIMVFCVVFGLSMDYEVFLLTRIKEGFDRTGDNRGATAEGLAATGGIITSAALIMVAVFGGFALADMLLVQMLGVGLAMAVLVDATLIRVVLVPALMRLMGRWNWWPGARVSG